MSTTKNPFDVALGEIIWAIRDLKGWTRLQTIARVPLLDRGQTLANYEYGIRPMDVETFVQVCAALGINPGRVLLRVTRAIQSGICPRCGK